MEGDGTGEMGGGGASAERREIERGEQGALARVSCLPATKSLCLTGG